MVSVPINFIVLVFTWLSLAFYDNNESFDPFLFVETSNTRDPLAHLELVLEYNPSMCLFSGPLATAIQKPHLLKLSKTRLVLQQTSTKQMTISDYCRQVVFKYQLIRYSQMKMLGRVQNFYGNLVVKRKLSSQSGCSLEAVELHL